MTQGKLIHAAKIRRNKGTFLYLFLRQENADQFFWYEAGPTLGEEKATRCGGKTLIEALGAARRLWKENAFRTLHCGFRYQMPQRDLVGSNAFFHQMAASYDSPNGVYFDEEVGNVCFVDNASLEALELWRKIKNIKKS